MRGTSGQPRITVLLATHNGLRWLPDQLDTILTQQGVSVAVVALDDMSTDGTHVWLLAQAKADPRVTVLPRQGSSGGAAANFYRLLGEVDLSPEAMDFVALADQDDLWLPGKLAEQAELMRTGGLDGISSNVTAFTADGKRSLIKKDYPQRKYDYLLESPGPGSTFLLTPRLVQKCREVLAGGLSPAEVSEAGVSPAVNSATATPQMEFHDWLIYGVCRAVGWRWKIQGAPTVEYRQHDNNAFGANTGVRSAVSRIGLIKQKWHRGEAAKMAAIALKVAPLDERSELAKVLADLTRGGYPARIRLARLAGLLRRRPRDRMLIAGLLLLGVW